jgi:hypothetical protein
MIIVKKAFSSKHRAYLLIFVCAYLALRLPILISSKIERVIIKALAEQAGNYNLNLAYKNLQFSLPGHLNFDQLIVTNSKNEVTALDKVSINAAISYPLKMNLNAEALKGTVSCAFTKGFFSSDLGINCNSTNVELSEIIQLKDFGVNGPLSFKFSGTTSSDGAKLDIKGEFLSQINSANLTLPKDIPSFVKIPNMGILDLKGNFSLAGSKLEFNETSLASTSGDVDVNAKIGFSPDYKLVVSLDSLFKLKLSGSGVQTLGPWIGLALGGAQFPNSGQANIEVKGGLEGGYKAKLVS